jgi:hypothetical protein
MTGVSHARVPNAGLRGRGLTDVPQRRQEAARSGDLHNGFARQDRACSSYPPVFNKQQGPVLTLYGHI